VNLHRHEPVTKNFHSARHARVGASYGGAVVPADPEGTRSLLEGVIAAFSILGGGMAYLSGYYASQALAQGQPPGYVAQRVNEGLALGFRFGAPLSIVALIITVWS
jgi:hypothetical protein